MERIQYTRQMTVMNADCDFGKQLRPSAMLRYVEQVSSEHAAAFGMDDNYFRKRHIAFLVGKQAAQIWRMPRRAENVTLTTACEQFTRGTMKRLTWLTDAAGQTLALVDCRWILIDTDSSRILRTPTLSATGFWNESLAEELPQQVHKSKELQQAGKRQACYSLCDLNGHINNAAYLDIACDMLPLPVLQQNMLRAFSVKYHREVPMGSEMELFYAPEQTGWYTVGRREGHAAFECYLEFEASSGDR